MLIILASAAWTHELLWRNRQCVQDIIWPASVGAAVVYSTRVLALSQF